MSESEFNMDGSNEMNAKNSRGNKFCDFVHILLIYLTFRFDFAVQFYCFIFYFGFLLLRSVASLVLVDE